MRRQLAHRGIVNGEVDTLTQHVQVDQKKHAPRSSTAVAYILFFLMYMVVMLYGMNVARSIIEEKTSRIFEVLLATIRPEEMMAGKIIGVGGVGLTQVAIWMSPPVSSAPRPSGRARRRRPGHRHHAGRRSSSSSSTSSSASSSTPASPPPSAP